MKSTTRTSVMRERLGSDRLPVLPANTPLLLRSLSRDELDFTEIASVIEQFPTIAGRLIALANSAWSSPVETITSLEQACARLGLSVVRSTSLALAVAAAFDPNRCPEFDAELYWSDALLCAEASFRLCGLGALENRLEPAAARAGGLLHNLGLLWIADRLPEEFGEATGLQQASEERLPLNRALDQVIGFNQADAGGLLARKWELPDELEAAMSLTGNHRPDDDQPMARVVGLAMRLCRVQRHEEDCPADDPLLEASGLSLEDCSGLLDDLRQQEQRLRELARTLFV